MKLLHIDSSITGAPSASRQLTAEIVKALRKAVPGVEVAHRDLDRDPIPHLDHKTLAATRPGNEPDQATRLEVANNASVLEEFQNSDIVVIGAPMYNFGIASQLKAWIDRIAIAGKTFRYTATGPEGLSGAKKVIVASARGGVYEPGTPMAAFDFQENYLRAVFAFLGVTDIEFVRAEGIAIGPEQREEALHAGFAAVPALTAKIVHGLKNSEQRAA